MLSPKSWLTRKERREVGFYRAFEERYRGSRADIMQRLREYEPFVQPYTLNENQTPRALDIGCGRGEWLELLQSQGFEVQGIDLDAGMLAACHERNLPAIQGDGLAYVAAQADNSWTLLSAFHVVEHIPFEAVIQLAQDALRVLEPGGLILFETPNPDNLLVASRDFYLDPSHQKPIPANLLAFVLEYVGFERVKVVCLNENPSLHKAEAELGVWEVISGASPDYAVVAQKSGGLQLERALDTAFEAAYGIDLLTLTLRYDQQQRQRLIELHQHNEYVQTQIKELNEHVIHLQQQAQAQHQHNEAVQGQLTVQHQYNEAIQMQLQQHAQVTQHEIEQLKQALNQQLEQANANAHQWFLHAQGQEQIAQSVLQSKSWKITKPLRQGMHVLRHSGQKSKSGIKKVLKRAMLLVLVRPTLRNKLNQQLQKYPRLYARLLRFAHNQGLVSVPAMATHHYESGVSDQVELSNLGPRARYAHSQLLQSVEKKNKG